LRSGEVYKTLGMRVQLVEHWRPPDTGWFKINVDGAFQTADGNGGGGVVIRNHHGDFLLGSCPFFPQIADAECSEILACRQGLVQAKEARLQEVVLETDSARVAAKLGRSGLDRSLNGALVEDVKTLLKSFRHSSVRSVRRTANEAAHVLAKFGCKNKLCNSWSVIAPSCIENQLVVDMSFD
jgi:ribonuclease HI